MDELTIEATDGRSLTVYDAGDPDGRPLLFHHGTPASGVPFDRHVELAREQGVRLLSYDRAGYGDSTRNPRRAVADVVSDVEAIADALELERFATWGISGGGPHALATAAGLPDRVVAVALPPRSRRLTARSSTSPREWVREISSNSAWHGKVRRRFARRWSAISQVSANWTSQGSSR